MALNVPPPPPTDRILRAILSTVLAMSCFSVLNAMSKTLTTDNYPVIEVIWARYFFAFIFMLAMFLPRSGRQLFAIRRLDTQVLRGLLLFFSSYLYFNGIVVLPLATAASISLTSPLIVTALSARFLNEPVGSVYLIRHGDEVKCFTATCPHAGCCVAFLLCTAVGYTSLVLQPKHFFHLEWVPWWFTAIAAEQAVLIALSFRDSAASSIVDNGRRWLVGRARRIVALTVIVLAALTAFLIVRQFQQARVVAIVADSVRHATDQPLASAATVGEDGSKRLTVAGLGTSPRSTPLVEDYLVFDVECGALEDAEIVGVYEQATSPRERMIVPCSRNSRLWKLFWPVYQHPPASRLRWFETASNAGIQIHAIHRIADLRGRRLLLKFAVPEDYEQRQWYHVLRRDVFGNPLGAPQGT